ncbi:MAG: 16S rRNA (guanine(527)-N(7))-methyltransferase RsmG [Candidatus Rokubacteria bacterium]|nr:16S rRNA (guanine(527)-N(7))-methyltransferase RsmG [Candidatus Rokubacteria bacterium]
MNLLIKWQKTHRLVGSTEPRWIVENLFLDSLLYLKVLPMPLGSLLDLGSGAGFPGVPIKIVEPGVRLTLLEARRRRASFLAAVVRELRLERVEVLNARAEGVAADLAGRFDAVVMRCAGRLEPLMALANEFVRPGGVVVASGPPTPKPLALGEWVDVSGARPSGVRRFALLRRT